MRSGKNFSPEMINSGKLNAVAQHIIFVPVAIPKTSAESEQIKSKLEECEIPTLLENEQTGYISCPGLEECLAVLVPEQMFEQASSVVMGYSMGILEDIDEDDDLDDDDLEDDLDDDEDEDEDDCDCPDDELDELDSEDDDDDEDEDLDDELDQDDDDLDYDDDDDQGNPL